MKLKLLLASALVAAAAVVQAQTYPTKAVRIIVPFPPGGAQDMLARTVAEGLGQRLGKPFVVENRPGAAGNLGAEALAKAPPDGHTLGIISGVHTANAAFYRKLGYDVARDFVPVRALGESAVLLVASKTAPFRNVDELIAFAKANPGKVNFGSTTSLTIDLLRMMTGAEVTMVTYKGLGDALQDLIGGRLDVAAGPSPQLVPLVKEGRVRALALASTRRLKELPGVKAIGESVPGYDAGMWYGLFAPAGTPTAIVRQLEAEVTQVLKQPAVLEKLATLGVDPALGAFGTADIPNRIQSESARWRAVAARTGNYAN